MKIDTFKMCLLLLALVGIFVKGFIPTGFMPDFSQHSGTAITICSGFQEKTIMVDDAGNPVSEKTHQGSAPCDFAGYPTTHLSPIFKIESISLLLTDTAIAALYIQPVLRSSLQTPPTTGPPAAI